MKKILIVDDEALARRILLKVLGKAGFEVIQASNGLEAWKLIESSQPDALVTDIDMPIMSGEELCKKISKEMPLRQFPIVVVTSKTALEHRTWAKQIEDVSFLEKPLSLKGLVERLHLVLDRVDEADRMPI